jgi:hypothetical protein
MSFSLPNFFFHATTAYDILRHKGAPLGNELHVAAELASVEDRLGKRQPNHRRPSQVVKRQTGHADSGADAFDR